MTPEWICARAALKYVTASMDEQSAEAAIFERARSGLVKAFAEKISWGDDDSEADAVVPKEFWKTERCGRIDAYWEAGDFCNEGDLNEDAHAYGVSFDFLAISDLVSAADKSKALRSVSVMADADWINSRDLQALMFRQGHPLRSGWEIIEPCKLGQLAGRAMRASGKTSPRGAIRDRPREWVYLEWDIPLWFWREFTDANSSAHDWGMGIAKGRGNSPRGSGIIELSGIHFHRSGLENLGLSDTVQSTEKSPKAKIGRKPTYDWQAAMTAIWGKIFRGELLPENQAMIERALILHLTKDNKEPSESTVRPYAKQVWEEFSKA